MNALSNADRLLRAGDVHLSEAERLIEIENGKRDVRANVFLVGMAVVGALTVIASLLLAGPNHASATTSGTAGPSVSAAR